MTSCGPDEMLARYLLSRSQFSRHKQLVKSSAFMPPPSNELSMFRIDGLPEAQAWRLGLTHVAEPQQRTLYGRADLGTATVAGVGLSARPDDDPPRHVSVVGWPEEKHAQKLIALQLAQAAALRLPPGGTV